MNSPTYPHWPPEKFRLYASNEKQNHKKVIRIFDFQHDWFYYYTCYVCECVCVLLCIAKPGAKKNAAGCIVPRYKKYFVSRYNPCCKVVEGSHELEGLKDNEGTWSPHCVVGAKDSLSSHSGHRKGTDKQAAELHNHPTAQSSSSSSKREVEQSRRFTYLLLLLCCSAAALQLC